MRTIVKVKLQNGSPVLPPFQAEDGKGQLWYTDDKGVVQGGYSMVNEVRAGDTVCAVIVDCPAATAEAIAADKDSTALDAKTAEDATVKSCRVTAVQWAGACTYRSKAPVEAVAVEPK